MDDKELANAVEALGIERWQLDHNLKVPAYNFVRTWAVAGALMEKVTLKDLHRVIRAATTKLLASRTVLNVSDSLPRAIIEACVAALTQEGSK